MSCESSVDLFYLFNTLHNWILELFNGYFILRKLVFQYRYHLYKLCLNKSFGVLNSYLKDKLQWLTTRPYQILVTLFNFLEPFPKVAVQLPIQFTTKIFLFNFCFTPPQNAFPWQRDKNRKNGQTLQLLMLDANFFSKDEEYPSSYLLSMHYISLTAQFFK